MDDGTNLLDALREELGCRSVKDGCSPQGQCGCCTVWVDGAPRVAVRHAGASYRRPPSDDSGGSAGGTARALGRRLRRARRQPVRFLHPGHRPEAGRARSSGHGRAADARGEIESALRAHLCRCTGWQSIVEAACSALGCRRRGAPVHGRSPRPGAGRLAGPGRGPGFPELGAPTWSWVPAASRTTPPRPTPRSQLGADADARPQSPCRPGRERAGTGPQQHRATVHTRLRCPRATGPSRCRRRGSSRPTSSPTPAGPGPDQARRLAPGQRWRLRRQAAQSGSRTLPDAGRRQRRRRCGSCGAVRTLCVGAPSARLWPWRCAPTEAASCASVAPRARPTSHRCWPAWRSSPGVDGRAGRRDGTARLARPPRRRVGRGAGGACRPRARRRQRAAGAGFADVHAARCPVPAAPGRVTPRRGDRGLGRGRRVGRRDPLSRDAAFLCPRRGAPGAGHGVERGDRRRRRRCAGRPHHPVLRHPDGA